MATQTYQSEAELENQLIKQLSEQGYAPVEIADYDALLVNFREQFCKFNDAKLNGKSLSDKEWERLTNYMLGNSVFESAKILRDKYVLERDDGTRVYVSFIDEACRRDYFLCDYYEEFVDCYPSLAITETRYDELIKEIAELSIDYIVFIENGERIIKYGVPIGEATEKIIAGQRVHSHNMKSLHDERSTCFNQENASPQDIHYELEDFYG